jgi:hypothetical protein
MAGMPPIQRAYAGFVKGMLKAGPGDSFAFRALAAPWFL